MTIQDLVTDAFRELRVLNAVDPPTGELSTLGLFRLNKILDNLNADKRAIYADQVLGPFTLSPTIAPHTIGPTGATWTTTQRPESIEAANLIADDLRYPIGLRDEAWWLALSDPTLLGDMPRDVWYEPRWPNGHLHFCPVPETAYTVELLTRVILARVALADTFTMPPGYQDMLTLTLAEDLAAPTGVELSRTTIVNAQKARARLWGKNDPTPTLATADYGLRSGCGLGYDHTTREIR